MTAPAASLPDLALARLQASVPGLDLAVGDHVRLSAYLVGLIDKGWVPQDRASLGPLLAPLLARNEDEQRAIHAFYAETLAVAPVRDRSDANRPTADQGDTLALGAGDGDRADGVRRNRALLGGLAIVVLALVGAVLFGGWFNLVTDVAPTTEQSLDQQQATGGTVGWLGVVSEMVAQVFTAKGALRAILMALPIGVAAWLMNRVASRRAVLDPEASDTARDVREVGLPYAMRTGLLSGPASATAFGRLRLRQERPSRRIDVRRTISRAAQTAGRVVALSHQTEVQSLGHLVLIDRRNLSDHLGDLGDLLVTRLREAGVPVQAYDMLADPGRVVPCRAALSEDVSVTGSVSLADQFRGDALVVVAEAERLLDRFGRRLAGWVLPWGDPRMIAVLTPRPPASWGRAERRLIALGLAVFPISAKGCRDYVFYRVASLGDRPHPPPSAPQVRAAWTIEDAAEAVDEATSDPAAADHAVFALRAALSPRAHGLISTLAIFPVVIPELTLRMRGVLGPGQGNDTAVLAELAALPFFRDGRLPFWLRKRLVAELPDDLAAAARARIKMFQDETVAGARAEKTLMIGRADGDGILRFLSSLGPRDGQRIADSVLFVRFMRDADISDLTVDASGGLRDRLDRVVRWRLVQIAVAGLVGAALMWVAALPMVAALMAALASLGALLEPVVGRENPLVRGLLIGMSLVAYVWVNSRSDGSGMRAARGEPGGWWRRFAPWLLPVLPAAALALSDAAMLALDLGFGARSADYGPGDLVQIGHLALSLFVLCIVLGRRASVPFDPVGFASARSTGQLLGGIAALVLANFFITYSLESWYFGSLLHAQHAGLLWAVLAVLASVSFATSAPTYRALLTGASGVLRSCFTLALSAAGFWGLYLVIFPAGSGNKPAEAAILLSVVLFPILFRAGLINGREWLFGLVQCIGLLGIDLFLVGGSARPLGQFWWLVLSPMPALAVLALTGLVLRRHIDVQRYLQRVLIVLFAALGLSGGIVVSGLAAGFAQDAPGTTVPCDSQKDPACLVGQNGSAGDPVAENPAVQFPANPVDLPPIVVVADGSSEAAFAMPLLLYLSVIVALGQWLWLRRAALDRGRDAQWQEGPMWIVLTLPVLLCIGLGFRLSDTSTLSLLPVYPVVAALLTWRFGFWGAATSLAGILPMAGQTGIAANALFGGAGIGMILTVLVVIRMVGERGYLARLLAIDTITPAQYGMAALIVLPVVGYGMPEIALRIEAVPGLFYWFALFVIGLSRVGLRGPALFVISAGLVQYVLQYVLPLSGESGVYAGYRSTSLIGHLNTVLWSLVVLAIGRTIRQRFIGDLGRGIRGHDGGIMAAMTRVFAAPAALWIIAFWSAILFKIDVGSEMVNPGSVGWLAAFAAGMCLWDWSSGRSGGARPALSHLGIAGIGCGVFLVAALIFGAFVPPDTRFDVTKGIAGLSSGVSPMGVQAMVTVYIVVGYVVGFLSVGLRRVVGASPDLWVSVPTPVRREKFHASAA